MSSTSGTNGKMTYLQAIEEIPENLVETNYSTLEDFFEKIAYKKNKSKGLQKYYDAQEFVKDAEHYFNLSPKNLIQTAAKLWQGCVYTVKKYFLEIGIHAVSHRSLKVLSTLAIKKCSTADFAVQLRDGWIYAEQFHQFSYGSTNFNPNKFKHRKAQVEFFISNFPLINKHVVKDATMMLFNNLNDEIVFKSEPGKINLGKEKFEFVYKMF